MMDVLQTNIKKIEKIVKIQEKLIKNLQFMLDKIDRSKI